MVTGAEATCVPNIFGSCPELSRTVACRNGNPRCPGRQSHHPLLAVLAEAPFVLHAWLRSGNTAAGRGVLAFLAEALALLPEGWRIRCVRADSGFFDQALLGFLEERGLYYIILKTGLEPLISANFR